MPKLGQYASVLKVVFFLYETKEDALAGTDSGGTGFFVAMPTKIWGNRLVHIHAITNWHVAVFNEDGPPSPVIRIMRKDGKPHAIDLGPDQWIFRPGSYDVAVSPPLTLELFNCDHDCVWLDKESFFLTGDSERAQEIGAADDVFMVGRFVDYDGVEANVPALRFGHISIADAKIEQHSGFMGRSIVLDMHSRSGFSGSPVFVYRTLGSHFMESSGPGRFLTGGGHTMSLLGMHWGQFPEEWELKSKTKTQLRDESAKAHSALITEGQYVEGLSGMTCAIPAAHIAEILDMPELQKMRDESEAELARKFSTKPSGPKPEKAPPKPEKAEDGHQERFKRLLGAAVKPPKSSD